MTTSKSFMLNFSVECPSVDLTLPGPDAYANVTFSLPMDKELPRLGNRHLIMKEMLRALRATSKDDTWSIRYASQLRKENLPFFHSAKHRVIIFDPLLPYRDCIKELIKDRSLFWNLIPSQSYFFKSQADSMAIFEQEKLEARQEQEKLEARPDPFALEPTPPAPSDV